MTKKYLSKLKEITKQSSQQTSAASITKIQGLQVSLVCGPKNATLHKAANYPPHPSLMNQPCLPSEYEETDCTKPVAARSNLCVPRPARARLFLDKEHCENL